MVFRYWNNFKHTLQNIQQAWFFADDLTSRLRLSSDFILCKLLKIKAIDLKIRDKERIIRCSNGIILTYRLNPGDLQSIREVWLNKAYLLPFPLKPHLVIDLGANIGLTSVWLYHFYGCNRVIAVEPSPGNASLVRRNFENNKINGTVVQAAIGATDGTVIFESSKCSNLGKVIVDKAQIEQGEQIEMLSMPTLLSELPQDQAVDLVKIDIEGGEQQLLSSNLHWLSRTKSMIVEFHPDCVDYPGLIKTVEQQGFQYIRANTVHPNNMDAFLREP